MTTNGFAPVAEPAAPAPPRSWARQGLIERLPTGRRQRRPAVAALGLLLVVVFAAVSAGLVARGDHTVAVLALAHDVAAGHQLQPSDLRVARISGAGVAAMSASGSSAVVGETVLANLPAGTLLTPQMLSGTPVPSSGQQLVAVALKPGLVPAEVTAGRDVSLVAVGSATGGRVSSANAVLVPRARVVSVRSDAASDLVVLSVQVDSWAAPQVAQLSAAGALSVTLLPVAP